MASKEDDHRNSVAGSSLWWLSAAWHFVQVMVLFSIIAIFFDIMARKYWWPSGTAADQMQLLIDHAMDRPLNRAFAQWCGDAFYWLYFKWNLIHDAVVQYARGETPDSISGRMYMRVLIIPFYDNLTVAMYGAQLFGIRLASMLLALPLFALVCAISIVDGLSARYIRKMCAGHESSSIYHRAKFYAWRLTPPAAAFAYLTLPFSIEPIYVFLPTALITGILLRTQMKYYKKHL